MSIDTVAYFRTCVFVTTHYHFEFPAITNPPIIVSQPTVINLYYTEQGGRFI